MNPPRSPEAGEVLKLGPPASGEVIITVDPSRIAAPFSAGTQTLLPGAEIPLHRHLAQDEVVFVHKGQGRALLNERAITVVPGAMLYIPRGAWHGLRNTGTGALTITWTAAPPGLEAFFREFARLGASPSAAALQELAQRHGIEFRPAAAGAPTPTGRHRRRHRGGRRHHGGRGPTGSAPPRSQQQPSAVRVGPPPTPAVSPAVSAAPSTLPPPSAAPPAPRRHRRRHRRRGRGGQPATPPPAAPGRREQAPRTSSTPAPPPAQAAPQPGAARQEPRRGRPRHRRVREVYMGGRWVRVEGEGPVIAPGRPSRQQGGSKRGGEGESPGPRLSVPL